MVSMFALPTGCIGYGLPPGRLAARYLCLVQEIAHSIVAVNRDENVPVLLVEQNSRMALRISNRASTLTTGQVAVSGLSAKLLEDERIKAAYLGGNV